ncbi:TetR/AcrR family transcriptional regulator [Marinobacterium weihaiense]|uniref:TetR/AcrR family transcriptional regulator n=1 Tax=Marinobacterium weihaiense TaxID=2851016 RepID=A0ABS6MEW6_9GAMM|nr:TetR/AcrR family transcriptional regulator [Marinobacterium weihaiense]MBV0934665.1 TetR/AcrR family transcriptional regulator [Marinobacterium weihaiense]
MDTVQEQANAKPCGLTPKGLERQRRILEAAREVFLEQGYDNASINDIMRRAGGSLSTLYRLFGNKLGLFEAMMTQTSNRVFSAFEAAECSAGHDDCPEAVLKRFGHLLLERVLSPEAVGLYRLVMTDCSSERDQIQAMFYAQGPKRLNETLSRFLQQQVEHGRMQIGDTELAAFQFLEMVKGNFQMRAMLGMAVTMTERNRAVDQAVELFLYGAAGRRPGTAVD